MKALAMVVVVLAGVAASSWLWGQTAWDIVNDPLGLLSDPMSWGPWAVGGIIGIAVMGVYLVVRSNRLSRKGMETLER